MIMPFCDWIVYDIQSVITIVQGPKHEMVTKVIISNKLNDLRDLEHLRWLVKEIDNCK